MPRDERDRQETQVVRDDTPFPDPKLYFKVFDSEKDEPGSVVREDVLKLYKRWEEKYGRKWPENGLNTEDLVWLQEEAYKDAPFGTANDGSLDIKGKPIKTYPKEEEDYEGQFIEDTDDARDRALASLPKDPKARKAIIDRAKEDYAEAAWVTDEFESEDYEAGNLEVIHDQYLWNKEGKPTIMPDGPPDEAQGEGSEEWDDVYGSHRPRGVDTDEVREAMWCTDEFESDEDNTESEWEPEYVGMGLGLKHEDPTNFQYSLRHSNHPLAPFPGEPLKWASYVYDDGTTYEGLTRDAIAHGMGVMIFGNGTGGGFHFREVGRGDKYEGEFQAGYAHGLGQFTSVNNGEVYVGEFFAGQRHGCGIKIDMSPLYYLMERGVDPLTAYKKTYDGIMRNIEFRTWYHGQALGDAGEGEAVVVAVRDDLGNPWDSVMKNVIHDTKLKEWKGMNKAEKVAAKMADIIDQININNRFDYYEGKGNKVSIRKGGPLGAGHGYDGYSSADDIEIMAGNTTEGGLGFGWIDGEEGGGLPEQLLTQVAGEALDDKIEESEDKEMVLGQEILNPTTGLSLKDYLDGKEGVHNELLMRVNNKDFGEDSTTYVDTEAGGDVQGVKLGWFTEEQLAANMRAYDALYAERDPYAQKSIYQQRNWADEDTDTRFETESDMMEMCDLAEILGTIDEVEEVVAKARMWRWKPYGEVTIRFAQDAKGQPVNLMQDPLHYPHNTKWMAPGPLGQCHPLPDDKNIRLELARVAKNYAHVHQMYNLDWDPEPGSVQHMVEARMKRAEELQLRRLERMAVNAAKVESELAGSSSSSSAKLPAGVQPGPALAALTTPSSTTAADEWGPGSKQPQVWGLGSGAPFASMSLSMGVGRASKAVLGVFSRAAKRAPVMSAGRPRLVRPSSMMQQQQGKQQQGGAAMGRRQQQQQQRQQRCL